ncbi:hypothetical protein EJB05_54486, partial [Eragrostis curvula]
MTKDYGLTPRLDHYACMVDMLSRAGLLKEAKEFIESITIDHGTCLWRIVLGSCRSLRDFDVGAYAGERLMELGTEDSSAYILLSNIYASQRKWSDVERVRDLMRLRGVNKDPGCSWVELNSRVNVFVVGEQHQHPEAENISAELMRLAKHMKDEGYRQTSQFSFSEELIGTVNNETLGYFIGRVYLFLTRLGIDKGRLRFRQHLPNEMAHMLLTLGCGDRVLLWMDREKSGVPLVAHEKFSKPREVEKLVIVPSKKDLGLAFKGNQKMVVEALEAMSEMEAMEMKAALESKGETSFKVCTLGKDVVITKKMVSISMEKKMEHQRVFTPSVIEPSFGIGRIIYCLFEHSFYTRPSKSEEELNVFRFPPLVAPIKCTVFPLVKNQEFDDAAKVIAKALTTAGISHIIDTTAISIGRRYARTDEIGVPFAVTVVSATSVTIRERDSKEQIRVGIDEVASVVKQLTEGQSTWADVSKTYPAHVGPQGDQE